MRFLRGAALSYGPQALKKRVWDKEYSGPKWGFADHTVGDCVYPHLDKYAMNGNILDLGCGSGNTATEMSGSYRSYTGVDISEEALAKAASRSKSIGREKKNRFAQGDFLSFKPAEKYDVVLFRESLYHIPTAKILTILDKYSKALKEGGVFIVRMYTIENGIVKARPMKMLEIIADNFDVLEKSKHGERGATVFVFRPKQTVAAGVMPKRNLAKQANSSVSA